MLTVKDLQLSYGVKPVLRGLSASFTEGCIHGLVGLNGSGKTTLFHALYGLKRARGGTIMRDGRPLPRRQLALLETENYFYSGITGREYLGLFRAPGPFALETWQELFRLPLDELISTYSTGMKKKLALTGVLKCDKDILLLDEPFNGVDLETGRIIGMVLRRLREKGRTVLVSSHVLETLTGLADYVHFLEDGVLNKTYGAGEMGGLERDLFGALEQRLAEQVRRAL